MKIQCLKKMFNPICSIALSALLLLSLAGGITGCKKSNNKDNSSMMLLMLLGMKSGWYTFLGGTGTNYGTSIQQTSDGGFIVAGGSGGDIPFLPGIAGPLNPYTGGNDMLVIKLDSAGAVSWYTFLGGSGYDEAKSIQQTSDGGFIVAGYANADIPTLQGITSGPLNPYTDDIDMLVVKLNSSGNVSWYTFLGDTGTDYANSIQQTSDDGFIVAGVAGADIPTLQTTLMPLNAYSANGDMLVVKLSSAGAVSWYTFIGGSEYDEAKSIQQTSDSGFIVAGYAGADIPSLQGKTPLNLYTLLDDMLVVKLDSAGAVSWYTFIGGSEYDLASSIRQTTDDGFIVAGKAATDIPTLQTRTPLNAHSAGNDMMVVKLDSAGAVSWYTFIGGSQYDYASSIQQTSDGGFIVAGAAFGDVPSLQSKTPLNAYSAGNDMMVVKLASGGSVSWYTFLGGTSAESASSIQQTTDGGFIVAGYADGDIPNLLGKTPLNAYSADRDMLVVKLNDDGSL